LASTTQPGVQQRYVALRLDVANNATPVNSTIGWTARSAHKRNKMIQSHKIILAFIVSFLSLYLSTISLAENNSYSLDLLEKEVEALDYSSDTLSRFNIIKTIVELDSDCIPILTKALKSDNREQESMAIFGLAIIGSDESLQILKTHANESDDEIYLLSYLKALCGRGKPQDLAVVIKILKENRSQFLTNHTSFNLVYLHPQAYKENLKYFEILKDNRKYFKKLIAQKGQRSNFESQNVENQIISKIIMSGIPRLNERKKYIDKENNTTWNLKGGFWKFKDSVWHCTKGINKSEYNYSTADIERNNLGWINFNTYISSYESRALVDVSLILGGLNGNGYVYVLKKTDGVWRITYFDETWIS
jgi:hypothetical protein